MAERGFAAIVLAAGGSTRLGRPKQLLMRDGETLLHRAARMAREAGASRVLVALGARPESMRAELVDLEVEVIINPDWATGLSGTLRVALAAIDAGSPSHETLASLDERTPSRERPVIGFDGDLLFLGCDQPALEVTHLRALRDAASQANSHCAATRYGEAIGIPAIVPLDLARDAVATLQGDRGLRALFASLARNSLGLLHAPELELDLDTAQDLERARRLGLVDRDVAPP